MRALAHHLAVVQDDNLVWEPKPPSRSSMKSVAWAIAAASRMAPSVTDSPANLRLDSTVPEKSMPCWGT